MARVRMTSRRRAANPPANPRETPDHPAFEPDPEVGDYGMSSDFAATPTTGPYPNSEHPATPDEGPSDHPAARKAARAKSARHRRRAAERKAAKCIRVAQSMLGPNATTAQVEDQAVDLMDLSDKAINTALRRLSNSFLSEDQNDPDGETLAPEGEPVIQLDPVAEMPLMSDHDIEAEELLALMLAEEAPEAPEAAPAVPAAPAMEAPMADEVPLMGDLELAPMGEDPMGLDAPPATDDMLAELFGGHMAADEEADDDEADDEEADDEEASKSAADEDEADEDEADEDEDEEASKKSAKSSDDEEADDEEADEDEASKKSARKAASKQRPRGRKASKGAKTLGAVTKAAAKSEISDLSKLWETAPDVSDVFGV
jgi:hypothetical protein